MSSDVYRSGIIVALAEPIDSETAEDIMENIPSPFDGMFEINYEGTLVMYYSAEFDFYGLTLANPAVEYTLDVFDEFPLELDRKYSTTFREFYYNGSDSYFSDLTKEEFIAHFL